MYDLRYEAKAMVICNYNNLFFVFLQSMENSNNCCKIYSYHNLFRNPRSAINSLIAMFSW